MRQRRLTEAYPIGTKVEILLHDHWHSGLVIKHDHPAVWVQALGGSWFVTNGRRIRSATVSSDEN